MDKLPAKIHHLSKEIRSCARMREGKQKRPKNRTHKPQETPRIAVAWKQIEIPGSNSKKSDNETKKSWCAMVQIVSPFLLKWNLNKMQAATNEGQRQN